MHWRFTLTGLLTVLGAVGVFLGVWVEGVRQRQSAISKLSRFHPEVACRFSEARVIKLIGEAMGTEYASTPWSIGLYSPGAPMMLLPKTPVPCRRDQLAPYIGRISSLEFLSTEGLVLADADLASIGRLHSLRCLRLRMTSFPDSSLGHLSDLEYLETLDAGLYVTYSPLDPCRSARLASAASDVPAGFLERMRKLRALDLGGRAIGDHHVSRIRAPDLGSVSLDHTAVTDEAVEVLVRRWDIKALSLNMTLVTEKGALRIAQMKGLRSAGLAYTDVTDVVIARFADLPALRELRIGNLKWPERITAGAVKGLRRAPLLKELYLHGVRFNTDQIREIKSALPGVFVDCPDPGAQWMTGRQHPSNTVAVIPE